MALSRALIEEPLSAWYNVLPEQNVSALIAKCSLVYWTGHLHRSEGQLNPRYLTQPASHNRHKESKGTHSSHNYLTFNSETASAFKAV